MAYAKRYAGGFVDGSGGGTPEDSAFLNAVEAALLKLFGVDASADGQALLWKLANSRYEPGLIKNANIDPAAAIDKTKLASPLNLADADIAAGASIAASKLAGNIPASKLNGYPAVMQQFLRGDGTWTPATQGIYRKTTAKQVVNTVAETDLLNGEITLGAGVLGSSGVLRFTAWGDFTNVSGSTQAAVRWKLKLGATTLIDTGAPAAWHGSVATRFPWSVTIEIANLGATNAQWAALDVDYVGNLAAGFANFTTGEGVYTNTQDMAKAKGGVSGTVDTTVPQALVLSVILPVASANFDVTLKGALVEVA